jgi:hypothetical protein
MAILRNGITDESPPRLTFQSLDIMRLEDIGTGNMRMDNPYEAPVGVSLEIADAGSVDYPLYPNPGNPLLRITITGDDGVTSASTTFDINVPSGLDAFIHGDLIGVVDPEFTAQLLQYSVDRTGVDLTVGVLPVTLDVTGFLEWSPPSGPSLMTGEWNYMPTGDVTSASFLGTLSTQFGDIPFNVDLASHLGGDMTILRNGITGESPPRLTFQSLDIMRLEDVGSGNMRMDNPYEAALGSAGGVAWTIEAEVLFNDMIFEPESTPPGGIARDVTWTVEAELLFNETTFTPEPDSHVALLAGSFLLALLARVQQRQNRDAH